MPTIFQGIFDLFSLNKKAIETTTAVPDRPLKNRNKRNIQNINLLYYRYENLHQFEGLIGLS